MTTVEALTAALPAFAEHIREATLLRPAPGTPGLADSSVGGPVLWPADEAWPVCTGPHLVTVREKLTDEERETWQRMDRAMHARRLERRSQTYEFTQEEADAQRRIMAGAGSLDLVTWERVRRVPRSSHPGIPMVPVLQLYARDVPGDHWPPGRDVLQLLWCPKDHSGLTDQPGHFYGPAVELVYRAASEVTDVLDPPRPDEAQDIYLAAPCVLEPLRVSDLPDQDELPEELHESGEEWAEGQGIEYHRGLACREGWKVGGWPSWHLTDLVPVDCVACGARTRLLLTMDSGGAPGLNVGRYGELRVFVCPTDRAHPVRLNIQ